MKVKLPLLIWCKNTKRDLISGSHRNPNGNHRAETVEDKNHFARSCFTKKKVHVVGQKQ